MIYKKRFQEQIDCLLSEVIKVRESQRYLNWAGYSQHLNATEIMDRFNELYDHLDIERKQEQTKLVPKKK